MDTKLQINESNLQSINDLLKNTDFPLLRSVREVVDKYGTIQEINQKAAEASKLETRLNKLKEMNSPYLVDLEWLMKQRETGAFIKIDDYKKKVLKDKYKQVNFNSQNPVTLEISALQYFPWLIAQAKQAIENQEIMPGRYIRVRMMKEQEADNGDLIATSAAMDIIGATWVETLDTKGADGSNVHLGGPETITGYFGGVGQPNEYALKWLDEYLYYYTNYGVKQVLNLNPGTVLMSYIAHKMGIDMEFKISVFMGNDNPYSVMWTLMTAKLFARDDGTTPLIGFNFANSVNNETIELCARVRKELGFEDHVRFEHHITETWKSIVRQPYDRSDELMELANKVANVSAKHEGGLPKTEETRKHPSDILDYFRSKEEVVKSGEMKDLEQNYLDKHIAVNRTAKMLTENGTDFVSAWNLH